MNCSISRFNQLVDVTKTYLEGAKPQLLTAKPSPKKWSKKEILGHLIDSAMHNLKRFTEIRFKTKPYQIIDYYQDELVHFNDYQGADIKNLIALWASLNRQIIHVIEQLDEKTLQEQARLPNQTATSLLFLINDYLEHLEYHVRQIIDS